MASDQTFRVVLPSKFLAIGDIHGDLRALKRALDLSERLAILPVCFGDIVGGQFDTECIDLLQKTDCLVLRGNHDQWAVEKASAHLSQDQLDWLGSRALSLCNKSTLAVHTNHEVGADGAVLWSELQSSVEIEDFVGRHKDKRFLLAAHTHKPSVTAVAGGRLLYVSTTKLRHCPRMDLRDEQYFIDVGWARENATIFSGPEAGSSLEYVFFE